MSANISIPRHTKASLVPWGNTFVNALEANPAAYNIDPLDVAQLRSLYDIFKADWDEFGVEDRKQNNAAAYTKAGRAQLDQSYDNFLGLASLYAVIIQADNSISIALKEAAGIVPRNFDREPVPAPAGQPLLNFISAMAGVHQLEFEDSQTPGLKAKPFGVIQIQLFGQIHDIGVVPDVNQAKLLAVYTKNPMIVVHNAADNGKAITYWAKWVTRSGLESTFGPRETHTILF